MSRRLYLALCLAALTACAPTPNPDDPVDGAADVAPEADGDVPDQAPPEGDMAPPEGDMLPADPDMGPADPDMDPPDPDTGPAEPDMGPPDPDGGPLDPDVGPPDPDMSPPDTDMAPPQSCVDGDQRAVDCGLNGRGEQPQVCVNDAWVDDGPCDDPDVCADGAEESGPCGPNDVGLATRTCVDGRWGEVGECVLPGVCEPGEVDEVGCGLNGRGVALRECAGGMWGAPGPCDDPDVCRDGSDEGRACGLNDRGETRRDCVDGQWAPFPPCIDPDVCLDGAAEERACGLNDRGVEGRTCVAGQWTDYSPCDDPDRCVDGTVEREPCGLNGRGTRSRTCFRGDFLQPEDCVDPDECVDGAREQRACGERGDGVESRVCDGGEWLDWSVCGGACADECPAGGRRCAPEGVEVCGDSDGDPCLEWGPAEACPAGSACVDGDCEAPAAPIVINEVLYDQAGADGSETFIELWGPPGAPLDGLVLAAVNGNDGRDYEVMPLDGVIGADGYYVVAEPGASPALIALADLLIDGADLQNGPDGLQLRRGDAVLDALGYGDAGDNFAGEGRPADDPGDGRALTRVDHVDTDDNAADFVAAFASPRGEPGAGPVECQAGEIETEPCGLNGRGERSRACDGGQWGPYSACDDPDACVDGATEDRVCEGDGEQPYRCVGGAWIADGPCVRPEICAEGAREMQACGGGRMQPLVCVDNAWVADGLCVGVLGDISAAGTYPQEAIPADAADDFTLTLDADAALRVSTHAIGDESDCPTDSDTFMTLYRVLDDGARVVVDTDDDAGWDLCSRIELQLPAGDYVVRVHGFEFEAVRRYAITVEIEPGLPRVDDGGDYDGGPIPDGGEDVYPFLLERPMIVEAFTSDGAGGCPGNTVMELHAGMGVQRYDFSDDYGGTLCSRIERELEPGLYELRVDGFRGEPVPEYVLTVRFRCVDGAVFQEPCADGIETFECVDGAFEPRGACGPPECAPGAVDEQSCGFNDRGVWTRTCVGERWSAFGPCADPDECVDGFEGDAPCGLNDRGVGPSRCVDGQYVLTGPCDDPDGCVEGALLDPRLCALDPDAAACIGVHRPSPACGINGWAMTGSVCVDGEAVPLDCEDPVACVPGAIERIPCGLNDRGQRERACGARGTWSPFGACRDPDRCFDGEEREDGCGPFGLSTEIERCVEGRWTTPLNCAPIPPDEVHGYVEDSYEAYAIRRVAELPDEQLQAAGLDRRVSGFVAGGDPYASLDALADVSNVVPETFDLLWAEAQARGWVPSCGDGVVMEVEEQCDDGNNDAGDGCDPDCRLETVCGDGVREGVEECDDGDVGAYDGCSPNCRLETHPTLAEDGGIQSTILPYLKVEYGNLFDSEFFLLDLRRTSRVRFDIGFRNPQRFWYGGEFCPFEAGGADYRVTLTARIGNQQWGGGGICAQHGDGIFEFDEILPPGLYPMRVTAENDFYAHTIVSGRIDVVEELAHIVCGDGVREGAEECDDGNIIDRDGCSPQCTRQQITEANDNIDRDATAEWSSAGAILRATGNISEGGAFNDRDHFIFESNGGRTVLQLSDRQGGGCDVDASLSLYRGINDNDRIAYSVDGGVDFCPRIETSLAAGTYSVVAGIAPPSRGGPYTLEVRTSPGGWAVDVPGACVAWCLATTDCTPLSQDELAQCTRRCADGTLPVDDMLRIRDVEACLLDAGDVCADLRACVVDADPLVDCDGACAEMVACGVAADDCGAACDGAAIACADTRRRLGGGCAETTPCFGAPAAAPVEHADCAAFCDARIACDDTVDRFTCEQGCIAAPGAAARRACIEDATCDQQARCLDLDAAVPAGCVEACDAVDGCGLFADLVACEAYCAGESAMRADGHPDGVVACVADVAACGYDMVHCFAPPICEGETAEVEVIDLTPGSFRLELSVTRFGIEDDFPPFCGFRGTTENFAALRLDFPAEVEVRNFADSPARWFLADRCDPEGTVVCGFDNDDTVRRVLGPGVYYLGAEQSAFDDAFSTDLEVSVRPLNVDVIP